MNTILEPILTDALIRWSKFNKPSQTDAVRILGPALRAICLDAKSPDTRATEWLEAQSVETITAESVSEFVRSVTEIPTDTLAAMRAKQAQLEKDVASKPLTARERVLLERQEPLANRSRESIETELYEAHHCKTRDGVELPDLTYEQWRALDPHYAALEQELAKRDCRIHGVPYHAPVKRDHSNDMVRPMRG